MDGDAVVQHLLVVLESLQQRLYVYKIFIRWLKERLDKHMDAIVTLWGRDGQNTAIL